MLKINRKHSPFLLFPLTLLLVIFLAAPWVNAQEASKEKPVPQSWEIKGIVAALNDPYARVRIVAANKLGEYKLNNPKLLIESNKENYNNLVQKLGEQLSSSHKDEQEKNYSRQAAAKALGYLKAKKFASNIVLLLKDHNWEITDAAITALENIQVKDIAKDVALLLRDSDSGVHNTALVALGNMQAKEFSKNIALLLKDNNTSSSAASALGNMQAKEFSKDIALLLKDNDNIIRYAAADALGKMQAKEFSKDIALLLKDSDSHVRNSAAQALGNMQAKEVASYVVLLLKDSDSDVRGAAANTLGFIQAKEFSSYVALLLKDNDPYVRLAAVQALGNMQASEFARDIALFFKDNYVRETAERALGNMRTKKVAQDMVLLLKNSDSNARSFAANVLGYMQAKEYSKNIALLLKDSNTNVRIAAASALGNMQAKEYSKDIALVLKDSNIYVRNAAVSALANMQASEFAYDVALLIKDANSLTPGASAEALAKLGKQDLPVIAQILEATLNSNSEEKAKLRFLAHFLSGAEANIQILLQWVGSPKTLPENPSYEQQKKALEIFNQTWKVTNSSTPLLRQELAEVIAKVVSSGNWRASDITLLQKHYKNLQGYTQAEVVKSAIQNLEYWKWIFTAKNTILIHITFWLALIFAYPKFPQVQAIFFWNPWVRRILGMGYVGFLLTWVPFFRRKLLEPFKFSLLADAGLDHYSPNSYFSNSKVLESGVIYPISQAIPSINGQIILEGDSGLGKSMFLAPVA